MDHVDALMFLLVAIGDLGLIAYLRKRRTRRIRMERMAKALAIAVRGQLQQPVRLRLARDPRPVVAAPDDAAQSYATVQ